MKRIRSEKTFLMQKYYYPVEMSILQIRISQKISESLLNRNVDYTKLEKVCKIIFSVNDNI